MKHITRFVQITDCHLHADPQQTQMGFNTLNDLKAVIKLLKSKIDTFDFILATGDIAQNGELKAYQNFLDHLSVINKPLYWLPGNHDDKQNMQQLAVFDSLKKTTIFLDHWQIVLLDSSVKGQEVGEFGADQLAALTHALEKTPDKYTLIAFHHQPVDVGSQWLRQHQIIDSQQLFSIVSRYHRVKGMLWGHIHQNYINTYQAMTLIGSPSTSYQFLANHDQFAIDKHGRPSVRFVQLHPDGSIQSTIHTVK